MTESQPGHAPAPTDAGKYVRFAAIAAFVILLDQFSKLVVLNTIPLYDSIPVVPGFFHLTHIQNPGGAFGFLARQGALVRNIVFLFVSVVALCLIFIFYRNTPSTHRWLGAGFALIFGGAVGNLIDRVRFGRVVDFLDVFIGEYHWPAFNVADSAVTIGIGIFIFHILLNRLPR
ncbi:MAG: signal peptidase II [Desulfobacterales bacterium]|nr:signal peptidase II [Desulfobacterales bacterium]